MHRPRAGIEWKAEKRSIVKAEYSAVNKEALFAEYSSVM